MRGFQPQQQAQIPAQGQSAINPQTLGLIMQAYKANMGQPTQQLPTQTEYAQPGMQGTQGAGYEMGQPLVAGGNSNQPQMTGNQGLIEAMLKARQMGQ